MYNEEEYKKRIGELKSVAMYMIENKSPADTRDLALTMNVEDAYIFGMCIGSILQSSELVQSIKDIADNIDAN